jgi:hypothetical protein
MAGRLPYPLLLRLVYLWYWARDLRRDRAARKRLRIPLLNQVDLRQYKKSDSLCILASGSSINQISAERWAMIAQMDTAGINFWLFHPFVPRMYFFEALAPGDRIARDELFFQLASRRAAEYADTLKVATTLPLELKCPPQWQGHLYTYEPIPVPARTQAEFRSGLKYLLRKGMFRPQTRIQRLFKQATSVSSLVALGVAMRYRRIILCGVDLQHSQYFFQDADLYPGSACVEFMPQHQPHKTNVAVPWYLPLTDVLPIFREIVLDPLGIEILVENKSSALWPAIRAWED